MTGKQAPGMGKPVPPDRIADLAATGTKSVILQLADLVTWNLNPKLRATTAKLILMAALAAVRRPHGKNLRALHDALTDTRDRVRRNAFDGPESRAKAQELLDVLKLRAWKHLATDVVPDATLYAIGKCPICGMQVNAYSCENDGGGTFCPTCHTRVTFGLDG